VKLKDRTESAVLLAVLGISALAQQSTPPKTRRRPGDELHAAVYVLAFTGGWTKELS
jgi:hypothetical protein